MIQSNAVKQKEEIMAQDPEARKKKVDRLVLREKIKNVYTMACEIHKDDKKNSRMKQNKEMLNTMKNQIIIEIDTKEPKSLPLIGILFSIIEKELSIYLPEIKIFVSTYLKDYANLAKVD
jgi:hypothetical protein